MDISVSFVCLNCGEVFCLHPDLDGTEAPFLGRDRETMKVVTADVVFRGYCAVCSNKTKAEVPVMR